MAKKTTKKTASKSAKAAKPAAAKPAKIGPAAKVRTKSDFYSTLADASGVGKRDVANVFDALGRLVVADLGKGGPGIVKVPGMFKVVVRHKPATKARMGQKPGGAPGEMIQFKAKPASKVIRVRPLKTLTASI